MKELNKSEVKESMTAIFDALMADSANKAQNDPLFEFLNNKKEWLGDPETMDCMINHSFKNIIKECVKLSFHSNDHILAMIYTNWDFFDNNVTSLTEKLEGSACSADRGRSIVKSYIKYATTGQLPEWGSHYGCPKIGSPEQWMNFIEGLAHLYRGRPEQYLIAYNDLIQIKKGV